MDQGREKNDEQATKQTERYGVKALAAASGCRGSLGNVFQALDQETGSLFAVKVLINTSDAADLQFKHALENEIQICSALKHPSIVTYLGHDSIAAYSDRDTSLYIYMEYMIGGSMSSVLHQFGAFEANVLMGQSADGGAVCRQISELCAKLADFGCSKRNADTLSHTLKGSIPFMAPEVVKNVGYGRMADIWSFGCVIIEMGTAQLKFDNQMAAMYKIGMSSETPPLPTSFSERCADFTQRIVLTWAGYRVAPGHRGVGCELLFPNPATFAKPAAQARSLSRTSYPMTGARSVSSPSLLGSSHAQGEKESSKSVKAPQSLLSLVSVEGNRRPSILRRRSSWGARPMLADAMSKMQMHPGM
ncbi:Mitogen-activated protein kinase kinase kinase A [Symbiodinium microadriaticum]|uniref:Mitogen-activated protein kinase kinase kinase A n=1 Tax=Symbiodinium microadriaticum TaxID=2951 RepID=A0A1Q9F2Q1_SYMMI|nr:Mitogen-activated protein kinase kinase kinase A [Symbiodinium microadriaticum]